MVHPDDKQTCLSGDRDLHFVGQLQSATSLPVLLGDEDLHQPAELCPLRIVQKLVVHDISLEESLVLLGKWLRRHLADGDVI